LFELYKINETETVKLRKYFLPLTSAVKAGDAAVSPSKNCLGKIN